MNDSILSFWIEGDVGRWSDKLHKAASYRQRHPQKSLNRRGGKRGRNTFPYIVVGEFALLHTQKSIFML